MSAARKAKRRARFWAAGTRVKKVNSMPGKNGHKDGDKGTVVAPFGLREFGIGIEALYRACEEMGGCAYMVVFDDMPGVEVLVVEHRLALLEAGDGP